jgi:hypothetical protein
MSIPGFDAALSLGKTGYRKTAYTSLLRQVGSPNGRVAGVTPSLFISDQAPRCEFPCHWDNHGYCVCPGGPVGPSLPWQRYW